MARYEVHLQHPKYPRLRAVFHCDAANEGEAENRACEAASDYSLVMSRLTGPSLGRAANLYKYRD